MSVLIKKVTIVLITIIMVSNFIMPNEVHAGWTEVGKELINGLFDLLRFIADLFLQVMQKMMVGVWNIQSYKGDSEIQYSPGIIFLDRVAGLKVNFIGANEYETEAKNNRALLQSDEELIKVMKLIDKYGYKSEIIYKDRKTYDEEGIYKNTEILKGEYTSNYLSPWGITGNFDGGGYGYWYHNDSDSDSDSILLRTEYRTRLDKCLW